MEQALKDLASQNIVIVQNTICHGCGMAAGNMAAIGRASKRKLDEKKERI